MEKIKSNLKLEAALKYTKMGLSIIPVKADKKPLIKWEQYQDRCPTLDEISTWWKQWPEANLALVTGKISGVVALDLDKKHNRTSKEFSLPQTVCAKTGGGGEHFFFKYPLDASVKSGSAISGEGVDSRGDSGYILLAPSVNENGGKYEWIVPLESKEDLSDMPEWFKKLTTETITDKKWLSGKDGVAEGSRNETATSMAGKILSSMDPKLWETLGWEQFQIWNNKNLKPLSEKELRGIWESIKKYSSEYDQLNNTKKNQAEMLLEIVEGKENVKLFHDDKKDTYLAMKICDHQEIIPLKSKAIRRWLTKEFWRIHKKAINADAVRSAIAVLEGKACYEGPLHILQNRLAKNKDDLWYDLTNDKWQAVQIKDSGWEVINEPPLLFNRYVHSKSQVIPSPTNGDIRLIFKYINLTNPDSQLLLLIYLVSCFIPDFPHPILVIFGPHGSAKSTLSRLLRRIVDPSLIEVAGMPGSQKELVQALAHHAFLFFDNVSYLSEEASDTLCKAITGSGFTKRELYTDDEDVIYNFKRSIGINGINLVATRPDLLDRSLLIELEMLIDTKRKPEMEYMGEFEKDLPLILGGIFDLLSKTLKIKPTIKLSESPRMADFALWGSAIAKVAGYSQEKFLKAYKENIAKQTESILNENMVAVTIISFMEERLWEKWEGTSSELLEKLTTHLHFKNPRAVYDKYWPKAANVLSRALNVLKITLLSADISIKISGGQRRKITIEKIPDGFIDKPVVKSIFTKAKNDTDDYDGKTSTLRGPVPRSEMPF